MRVRQAQACIRTRRNPPGRERARASAVLVGRAASGIGLEFECQARFQNPEARFPASAEIAAAGMTRRESARADCARAGAVRTSSFEPPSYDRIPIRL